MKASRLEVALKETHNLWFVIDDQYSLAHDTPTQILLCQSIQRTALYQQKGEVEQGLRLHPPPKIGHLAGE
jgi:hypothetical protein